jgi:hypothetical protein
MQNNKIAIACGRAECCMFIGTGMEDIIRATALLLLALSAFPAAADPTGTFDVVGINPGGGKYRGSVQIERHGEVYRVVWQVSGTRYIGTGLGAKYDNGRFVVGPASPDDVAISIGYVSSGTFGQAFYAEVSEGIWKGVWTYAGSDRISTEEWTRR